MGLPGPPGSPIGHPTRQRRLDAHGRDASPCEPVATLLVPPVSRLKHTSAHATRHRCRPSRVDDSTARRAIRAVIPRRRSQARLPARSSPLSASSLLGRRRRPDGVRADGIERREMRFLTRLRLLGWRTASGPAIGRWCCLVPMAAFESASWLGFAAGRVDLDHGMVEALGRAAGPSWVR
jgi:hypothetical protein